MSTYAYRFTDPYSKCQSSFFLFPFNPSPVPVAFPGEKRFKSDFRSTQRRPIDCPFPSSPCLIGKQSQINKSMYEGASQTYVPIVCTVQLASQAAPS